jgi:two-component system nitrogen regulation response regulator NtrX
MAKTEPRAKILVVDDEKPIREVLSASLTDDNYQVSVASNAKEGLEKLTAERPQVVLLDIWMPGGMDGIQMLQEARVIHPTVEFIVMSGHGNIETAVKATKLGAWDFVEKPLSIEKIQILLNNILSYQQEKEEKSALLTKLRKNVALIGESAALMNIKHVTGQMAQVSAPVLITGENGTGKELVAQNIHYLSPRASRSFVEVNCATVPEELIDSELFGFEKGAFAGALRNRRGKVDFANGGTLFLDEITDLNLKTQEKLLKLINEKGFYRSGGDHWVDMDVRIIAATQKNLDDEIREGRFLPDLYFRLNSLPMRTPPLRNRREDIPSLVMHFSELFSREGAYRRKFFSDRAMDQLRAHDWPGNVRELRNFVERLYILISGEFIDAPDLKVAGLQPIVLADSWDESLSFREARAQFEKDYLLKKISENNGNISKTAELIGLERSYLHRKIKTYGIDVEELV